MRLNSRRHRLLVSEVIQTSDMDCGPACLASLLRGFDIQASYERLREACHTGLDGTSIDTLEDMSNQLGLEAEQVMLPLDHLLLANTHTFPAICCRLAEAWAFGSTDGPRGRAAVGIVRILSERCLRASNASARLRLAGLGCFRRVS